MRIIDEPSAARRNPSPDVETEFLSLLSPLLRFLLFSEQEVSENGEVGELNQLQSLS
jgi:hypothetical protein